MYAVDAPSSAVGFMVLSVVIWALTAWWCAQCCTCGMGRRRGVCFCVTPSYWCPSSSASESKRRALQAKLKAELASKEEELAALDSDVAAMARRCLAGELRPTEKVVLCDLRKSFGRGKSAKQVVRDRPTFSLHHREGG